MTFNTCTEPRDCWATAISGCRFCHLTKCVNHVHVKETAYRWRPQLSVRGNAVKHGDMCGLNATNPLDARTPPPLCPWWSALSSAHAKEQKQLPNGSQDGVEAWACDMVLIGKRLEGCDKMRQAHQARLASGGRLQYFSPTRTFTLPLHSNQQ